jgi:hypothetical protein
MVQLDSGKNPKEIDVHWKIIAWQGIYRLNGDDLTLCVRYAGEGRPTNFTTKPGSQTLLLVYKRDPGKRPKVLTPEQAIKRSQEIEQAIKQSQEKVTVMFKVTVAQKMRVSKSNVIGENAGFSEGLILKDGNSFAVQLLPPAMDTIRRLGIEPDKHFKGKVVQVTGLLRPGQPAFGTGQFQIVVNDLTQLKVVGK